MGACDDSELTSLLIQLLQDLPDDLADALQRLDVFLRDIILLLQVPDAHAQRLELGFPFSQLQQGLLVVGERLLPLGVVGAVHGGGRGDRRRDQEERPGNGGEDGSGGGEEARGEGEGRDGG